MKRKLKLAIGTVTCGTGVGAGAVEALKGSLTTSSLLLTVTWISYFTMHHTITGKILDRGDPEKSNKPENKWLAGLGIITMTLSFLTGAYYASNLNHLGASASGVLFLIGFMATHHGFEEKPL